VQEHCENLLALYSLASASQLWSLTLHSHSSCCWQQGTSNPAEICLNLLPSLKTHMWYMWHVYHIISYCNYAVPVNLTTLFAQLHIYARNSTAICVHTNTAFDIENKSFSAFSRHGLCYYEVGALQHTRLRQCTMNKAYKWNAIFCPNFQVSQSYFKELLINSYKPKPEVTRKSFLILYMFNMFFMT